MDTEETRKYSTGGGITEALDTGAGGGRGHHTIEVIGYIRPSRANYGEDRERIMGTGGLTPTLRSTDYKEPMRVGVLLSEIQTLRGMG